MDGLPFNSEMPIPGFSMPVHRALTESILLGGAPRAVAILNGALGLGLRLWIAGLLVWVIGHTAAVWAAKPGSPQRTHSFLGPMWWGTSVFGPPL